MVDTRARLALKPGLHFHNKTMLMKLLPVAQLAVGIFCTSIVTAQKHLSGSIKVGNGIGLTRATLVSSRSSFGFKFPKNTSNYIFDDSDYVPIGIDTSIAARTKSGRLRGFGASDTLAQVVVVDANGNVSLREASAFNGFTNITSLNSLTTATQTFSGTGITITSSGSNHAFSNNFSTGVSGGQTLIGSTSTNAGLTIKSTTGIGVSGADIIFQVGNNGATEVARMLNNGALLVGTSSQSASEKLRVSGITQLDNGTTTRKVVFDGSLDNILSITSDKATFTRFNITNTSVGGATAAGGLFVNDLGNFLQFYVGSSTNSFVPNGVLFRSSGAGGLNIAADNGVIAFAKNPVLGQSEHARFLNNGAFLIGTTTQAGSEKFRVNGSSYFGNGNIIAAGAASANSAPLKFTTGTLLTTPEAGAVEYDGSHLYFTATDGGTRYQLDQQAGGATSSWSLTGNTGINASNFLGTTDTAKLIFKTNNTQRASILSDGTINFAPNDTTSKPLFRVYPNGDFTVRAKNNLTGNVFGPNNGIRYNSKYGILEVGTNNNFDTTLGTSCCGSQVKSAIIINSDFVGTFKGHIHGSIVGGDNMTVDTSGQIAWSPVFGEHHYINAPVVKSSISGYGMNIRQQITGSTLSGFSHQITKYVTSSLIVGYANSVADSVNSCFVAGGLNTVGGIGQTVSGVSLIDKTPYGTVFGNANVNFTSLNFIDYTPSLSSQNISNLDKYPLFSLGNSKYFNNPAVSSNAVTVLFNGRTQINTTGFGVNLTETDVTPKAALEIVSKNSGILIPRLTTGQRDSIITADLQNGLLLYNTTSNKFQYYNGTSWLPLSDSSSTSSSGWSLSGNSTSGSFLGTTNNSSIHIRTNGVERMIVDSLGNIGVGTSDTKGYRFSVNGDAIFTKIKVKQYSGWPDYVFAQERRLPKLEELERYINDNKHLPDVPSASEVEKSGLDVGDNQAMLLKKIEELTLYVIDINKKVEKLTEENAQLKKKLESVKQ